jgi:hypothetical protein
VSSFSPAFIYPFPKQSHKIGKQRLSQHIPAAAAAVKYKFCAKPAWKSFWNKFNYRNLITINPSRSGALWVLLPLRKASRIKCSELAEITGEKPNAAATRRIFLTQAGEKIGYIVSKSINQVNKNTDL